MLRHLSRRHPTTPPPTTTTTIPTNLPTNQTPFYSLFPALFPLFPSSPPRLGLVGSCGIPGTGEWWARQRVCGGELRGYGNRTHTTPKGGVKTLNLPQRTCSGSRYGGNDHILCIVTTALHAAPSKMPKKSTKRVKNGG